MPRIYCSIGTTAPGVLFTPDSRCLRQVTPTGLSVLSKSDKLGESGEVCAACESEKTLAGDAPVLHPVRGGHGLSGPVHPGGRGGALSVLGLRRRPGRGWRGGGTGGGSVRWLVRHGGRAALLRDGPGGGAAGERIPDLEYRRDGADGALQRGGAVLLHLRLPLHRHRIPQRPGPRPPPAGDGGRHAGGGLPGAGPGTGPLPAPGPGHHRRGRPARGHRVRQPLWHAGGGLCPGLPPVGRPAPAGYPPGEAGLAPGAAGPGCLRPDLPRSGRHTGVLLPAAGACGRAELAGL